MGIIAELIPILSTILTEAPQLYAEVQSIWALASSQQAPSPEQQAQIDAALDAAHKALQAS